MEIIKYQAKIEKDNSGYVVEFPDLPGCFSYGATFSEAKKNAVEALELYLEEANDPKWMLPRPTKHLGVHYHWITPGPDIVIPIMIREARKKRKLSQESAASLLEMKIQTYQKLEYPRKSNPTAKTLLKIAAAFKITFELSA